MGDDITRGIYSIDDLRRRAKRMLPKGIFEFIDRGTEDEVALSEMLQAFARIKLTQRAFVDVSKRSLATTILGTEARLPFIIGPTGAGGLCAFNGELSVARAAAAAGIPSVLAMGSIASMERVTASAPSGRHWFQLYMLQERELTYELVERANANGCEAIVLTVDQPLPSIREYNTRNGFVTSFQMNASAVLDCIVTPQWTLGVLLRYVLAGGMPRHENYPKALQRRITSKTGVKRVSANDTIVWDDVEQLRRRWPRKLVIKGLLRPEDAVRCAELGVDAVVVSSHGGRTFDSSPLAIEALPRVVDAVNGRAAVFYDSGIRRGSDIAKAIALGADAALIGRPSLYGVAADGQRGVTTAIEILRKELDVALGYLGCRSISELNRDCIHRS